MMDALGQYDYQIENKQDIADENGLDIASIFLLTVAALLGHLTAVFLTGFRLCL